MVDAEEVCYENEVNYLKLKLKYRDYMQ